MTNQGSTPQSEMKPLDIEVELQRLKDSRLLRTDEEFDHFEGARENLIGVTDPAIIPRLCEAFDDATEDHEVMFGLVHFVEHFDREAHLLALAKATPSMLPRAREWAEIFHYRILNNPDTREMYRDVLIQLDNETQQVIVDLLNEIKDEDPLIFKDHVDEILEGLTTT
jgi:hypothetical protein